jgi:hypothetical protein
MEELYRKLDRMDRRAFGLIHHEILLSQEKLADTLS